MPPTRPAQVGERFDRLLVIEDLGLMPYGAKGLRIRTVRCLCDCGNVIVVRYDHLKSGNTKSCGCLKILPVDPGDIFGRLTVLSGPYRGHPAGHLLYECRCECGTVCRVPGHQLIRGTSLSCGCLRREGMEGRLVTAFGKTQTVAQWVEDPCCSVDSRCVYHRLQEGWTPEEAIGTPAYHDQVQVGDVYGYWTVQAGPFWSGEKWERYQCVCKCGTVRMVRKHNLLSGHSRSCGCIRNGYPEGKKPKPPKIKTKTTVRWVTAFDESKSRRTWMMDPCCVVNYQTFCYRLRNGWLPEVALTRKPRRQPTTRSTP